MQSNQINLNSIFKLYTCWFYNSYMNVWVYSWSVKRCYFSKVSCICIATKKTQEKCEFKSASRLWNFFVFTLFMGRFDAIQKYEAFSKLELDAENSCYLTHSYVQFLCVLFSVVLRTTNPVSYHTYWVYLQYKYIWQCWHTIICEWT